VTRSNAKSFYFCARFLAPEKRSGIYAVYALCRHLDDLVDSAPGEPPHRTRAHVESWRRRLVARSPDDHPALVAWHAARARFGIDPALAEALVDGVLMDLAKARYETFEELDVYCYRVASVVGLMVCSIFGYSDAAALGHAADLGRAMQLTNICRDVGEDARLGRVYLPLDECARFGVSESSILAGVVDDRFRALMRFQVARARSFYALAEPGIAFLNPDCRFTVRLSSRIYGQILDRIERNGYDVQSRRAFVPFGRKVATIPRAWLETYWEARNPSARREARGR
jgi:phytoene synthase